METGENKLLRFPFISFDVIAGNFRESFGRFMKIENFVNSKTMPSLYEVMICFAT